MWSEFIYPLPNLYRWSLEMDNYNASHTLSGVWLLNHYLIHISKMGP